MSQVTVDQFTDVEDEIEETEVFDADSLLIAELKSDGFDDADVLYFMGLCNDDPEGDLEIEQLDYTAIED